MADIQNFIYNEQKIVFEKIGSGKPLVILHGWGSSRRVMMPIARSLESIRTSYILDLPGFGDSPEPTRSWSIDDYTDAIESFISNTFNEPVDLLVHSFGGRITLKLCARESGKKTVDKVLITGGAGMKPKRSLKFYFKKYLAKTIKAPFLILPSALRDSALNKLRQTALWKSLGSGDYNQLSGVMRGTFVKSVTEHLEKCMSQIPHETFLLWGEDDDATPVYQGKRLEKGIKNAALVVIENAGHYAFLDRPKHFAVIAEAFFKS
ncbi:MAG: alpha/beta hydrolase [Balneola sp.]